MSTVDEKFVYNVRKDIKSFLKSFQSYNRVLIFPPVNNYRRFLVHRTCEEFALTHNLVTFSVGSGIYRRTVVCFKEQLKIPVEKTSHQKKEERDKNWRIPNSHLDSKIWISKMGVEQINESNHSNQRYSVERYCPPALRKCDIIDGDKICKNSTINLTSEKDECNAQVPNFQELNTICNDTLVNAVAIRPARRERRPDRAVYVPRARRSQTSIPNSANPNFSEIPISTSLNNHSVFDDQIFLNESNISKKIKETHQNRRICDQTTNKQYSKNIEQNQNLNFASTTKTIATSSEIRLNKPVIPRKAAKVINNCDNQTNNFFQSNIERVIGLEEQKQSVTKKNKFSNFELISNCDNTNVVQNNYNSTNCLNRVDKQNNQHITEMNKINKIKFDQQNQKTKLTTARIENSSEKLNNKIDHDAAEFERASKKINRSNRRIIKQTFKSDILEIPEPTSKSISDPYFEEKSGKTKSFDPEIDDWDSMFDDNGECLDPRLIEELTSAVGKVQIDTPKSDYSTYLIKQEILSDEEFPHVLEISNFPVEFKTQDLMMIFSCYKESGFDIKWVDDTHALVVFSSSKIAAEVLARHHPFVVLKPLADATFESRCKAKKCSHSLQPYRPRPETCAALARRLVTGALGVRLKTAAQERENEKKVLKEAKERKLLAAKQREEIWES